MLTLSRILYGLLTLALLAAVRCGLKPTHTLDYSDEWLGT